MRTLTLLVVAATLAISRSYGANTTGGINGTAVHRHNGTWLGIQITSNNFFVTFYDKNKKPMAADATDVVLSWTYPHAAGTIAPVLSTQLSPRLDISSVFTSSYSVPYPHKMTLRVILTVPQTNPDATNQTQTEVYVVNFTASG
jgi:hypothetical protein